MIVSDVGHPTFGIGGQSAFCVCLRGEGVKAEISLVCMTLSNALERSIDMVTVRWGLQLVKASCDLVGDGAEGSGGDRLGQNPC